MFFIYSLFYDILVTLEFIFEIAFEIEYNTKTTNENILKYLKISNKTFEPIKNFLM
jgi:hypothetical protein